ncbi:hypothetical protein [Methanoregula sp.]
MKKRPDLNDEKSPGPESGDEIVRDLIAITTIGAGGFSWSGFA